MKKIIYSLIFFLYVVGGFAQFENDIEPPPPAPIDDYLLCSIIVVLAFAGYFFYKSKTLINKR